MVSFRGQKKAWAPPRSVSFRGLIQNFRRTSPPLSYAESTPPPSKTVPASQGVSITNRQPKINVNGEIIYNLSYLLIRLISTT